MNPVGRRVPRWRAHLVPQLLVVALVLGGSAFVAGAPAQAEGPPLVEVGTWHVFGDDSAIQTAVPVVDPSARVLYAFSSSVVGNQPLRVQAWHLDTRKPLGAPYVGSVGVPVRITTPIAVDETNHVVVVARMPVSAQSIPALDVLRNAGGATSLVGAPATRFPPTYVVAGVTIDAAAGLVYVIAAPRLIDPGAYAPPAGQIQIDAYRLSALAAGRIETVWVTPYTVPLTCSNIVTTNYASALLSVTSKKSLYFACVGTRGAPVQFGPNIGDIAGIARVEMPGADPTQFVFDLKPVSGNLNWGDALAVPALDLFVLASNTAINTNFKVYDARSDRIVGNVGINGESVAGFTSNPHTGQSYFTTSGGIGKVQVTERPIGQGRFFEQYKDRLSSGKRVLAFDTRRGEILLPSSDDNVGEGKPYLWILRDRERPVDNGADNVEAGAIDVPERPGFTHSVRSADTQGYGAQIRVVGGTTNFIENITHVDTRGVVTRPGTRELTFAGGPGMRLSNDESIGELSVHHQDQATTSDNFNNPVDEPARCADFGGSRVVDARDGVSVTCDLAAQRTSGAATYAGGRVLYNAPYPQPGRPPSPVPAPPPAPTPPPKPGLPTELLQVRSASYDAVISREGSGPMTTKVVAEASGIDVHGLIQIGRVRATATTTAAGRSGTANTHYTSELSDVVVAGQRVCQALCNNDQVRRAVNRLLAGRAVIDLPAPGVVMTPRGVLASVGQDPNLHTEMTIMDGERADSFALPAVQVTLYTEGNTQSRTLLRFAAVSTYSLYKITAVPQDREPPVGVPTTAPGGTITLPPVEPGAPEQPTTTVAPTTPVVAQPDDSGTGPFGAVVRVIRGLRVLFREPGDAAAVAALWALLALPVYLAARRRLLVEMPRPSAAQEVTP